MKTAQILVLIDIQNGFAKDGLTPQQGGSLYVPGGEQVGPAAAGMIRDLSDSIIVLSQDFHPDNHISFASNHKGSKPLESVWLKKGPKGVYQVAGRDEEGAFAQTLWPDHCVQKTKSALFVDEIMHELPNGLSDELGYNNNSSVLLGKDRRGNLFYVIRKGMRPTLDSYGIATENDGVTLTIAPLAFEEIAMNLQEKGVETAKIGIGGLATNFCVEASARDLVRYLVPALEKRGIKAEPAFLSSISRGVPIETPDGSWPDLKHAPARIAEMGFGAEAPPDRPFEAKRKDHAAAPSV